MPDTTLADCPALDVICVPGGSGVLDLMDDETVLAFLRSGPRRRGSSGRSVPARWVLGAAGLLRGKRATTHWAWMDLLTPFGAIPTNVGWFRDGKLMTGGGVSAGIDFGLTMVAELAGQEAAESIQLGIEYAPGAAVQCRQPG